VPALTSPKKKTSAFSLGEYYIFRKERREREREGCFIRARSRGSLIGSRRFSSAGAEHGGGSRSVDAKRRASEKRRQDVVEVRDRQPVPLPCLRGEGEGAL
jgi:hypothetical protein